MNSFYADLDEDKAQQKVLDDLIPIVVTREEWGAKKPLRKRKLEKPVTKLVFVHTNSTPCYDKKHCMHEIRKLQERTMGPLQKSDINHNFVIGSDGSVFEARGWDNASSKIEGDQGELSGKSIEIAFIGYKEMKPNSLQIKAALGLVILGIKKQFLTEDVSVYQFGFTDNIFPTEDEPEETDPKAKFTAEFVEFVKEIDEMDKENDPEVLQKQIDELFENRNVSDYNESSEEED